MLYHNGVEVRIGDHIRHAAAEAMVEVILEGKGLKEWNLEEPGFMLLCEECGRVFINPSGADWEDAAFLRRA